MFNISQLIGVFANLGKGTINFAMSVCLNGTTWLPLDGFS